MPQPSPPPSSSSTLSPTSETWSLRSSPPRRRQHEQNHHSFDRSSYRQQQQKRRRRGFWSIGILCLGGCCYLQIVVNFLVYQHHQYQPSYYYPFDNLHSTTNITTTTSTPVLLSSVVETLQKRTERMRHLLLLQQQQQVDEEEQQQQLPPPSDINNDQGSFLAFTIRDARRTVPTQIPYGFHVLDFIDVHNPSTYGFSSYDDKDEKEKKEKNETVKEEESTTTTSHTFNSSQSSPFEAQKQNQSSLEESSFSYPLPLFHNGFPVPFPYNTTSFIKVGENTTHHHHPCQNYSTACYRSNMIQVIRYLLETPTFRNVTYFFYMEADHDLCVSLSYIRSMAFRYQRYIISVGRGASGWIMNRTFLQDFYDSWYHYIMDVHQEEPSLLGDYHEKVSTNQWLQPDVVATALLREKNIPWSLSRRYLTSHTILTSTAFGVVDQSLTDHFEYDKDAITNSTTTPLMNNTETNVTDLPVVDDNKSASSNGIPKTTKVELLPPLVPKVHLPRCLEPRKGILPKPARSRPMGGEDTDDDDGNVQIDDENSKMDMMADPPLSSSLLSSSSWDMFDYVNCPDAPISPCDEDEMWGKKNDGSLVTKTGRTLLRGRGAT